VVAGVAAVDPVTHDLYVQGTVFVDGDLYMNTNVDYSGKGTFIVTGDIHFYDEYLPSGGWETYPVTNAVGFATPNNIEFNFNMGNVPDPTYADAHLAGAWYAGTALLCDDHLVVRGSILSNNLNFGTHSNIHLLTDPALPDNLPPSLPGGDDARTVFITRWHEGD
jgi:hypothetical protein